MKKSYKDIQDFIKTLEDENELLRISKEVSPELDISKITDAESKKPGGGKALLFENVVKDGKKTFPVATNLFGSEKRMSMALGVENFGHAQRKIEEIVSLRAPKNFSEFLETAKKFLPLTLIAPRKCRAKTPPCQEVVMKGEDVDLSQIPVLKCWPKDGGAFFTLPLVFTRSPDKKERNLGMYRLQVFDKNTTGMHWHIHKDGAHFFREYSELNMRMPVAVAVGADPASVYAATAPLPRGADELLLAGFFRGKGVPMAKCLTVDLEVPADAEFVLEGYVDPKERRLEGPFGDHTGYYSAADMYPVFHVTALTRKEKPVYCATLVGPPPMEDCYMAKATERIFLPLLRSLMPEIVDIFMPWEGVFHNIAIVSIDKEYPAHARKVANGLWGQGQMSFCKALVFVDRNVIPSDLGKIWSLFLESFDPTEDAFLSGGILDVLDHSSPKANMGSKIGFDLTRRARGEPAKKSFIPEPASLEDTTNIENFMRKNFKGFEGIVFSKGFCAVAIDKAGEKGRDILSALENSKLFEGKFRALALFDADVDISDTSKILWKIFNNVDPERDILFCKSGLCMVDACKKSRAEGHPREWPEELRFDK